MFDRFDEPLYLREMASLVAAAQEKMKRDHRDSIVYTVSIWTDPDAAASAISIDTLENSIRHVSESNAWWKKERDRLVADGDLEMAKLFCPNEGRNCSPADFRFRNLAEVSHASIPSLWEEFTQGKCWDSLEPALKKVAESARIAFADLQLDPQAIIGVNSRRDWFDLHWQ